MSDREPVIIIVGPTASGKTSIAVELAKKIDGEVISADSRQIYKFMDVGTAKPKESELCGIRHYGFDIVDPSQRFSAGQFGTAARNWVEEIYQKGKRPIVAGGSGLYVEALVDGFVDGSEVNDLSIRKELTARADCEGLSGLYEDLKKFDPLYATKIFVTDRQRILRALEVYLSTGNKFSELHLRDRDKAKFQTNWFGLKWNRDVLYDRIDRRVDVMLDHGLLLEVNSLIDRGFKGTNAMKSVGYEEITSFYDGSQESLKTAKELIKKNTRNYAKRQLTWFRRNERIKWIDLDEISLSDTISKML
jgi:tRNA dimethylallyltransferase